MGRSKRRPLEIVESCCHLWPHDKRRPFSKCPYYPRALKIALEARRARYAWYASRRKGPPRTELQLLQTGLKLDHDQSIKISHYLLRLWRRRTNTVDATKPFPFKSLARELRDCIYGFYFERDEVTIVKDHTFAFEGPRSPHLDNAVQYGPQYLLAIMLVDHQIHDEAATFFYGQLTVALDETAAPAFSRGIGTLNFDMLRKIKLCVDGNTLSGLELHSEKRHDVFARLKSVPNFEKLVVEISNTSALGPTSGRQVLLNARWEGLAGELKGLMGNVNLVMRCTWRGSEPHHSSGVQGFHLHKVTTIVVECICKKGASEWVVGEPAIRSQCVGGAMRG